MVLRTLFALRAIQLTDRLHNWAFPNEREYKIKESFFLYHLKHCIKESIPDVEKWINYYNRYTPSQIKIEHWSCQKDHQNTNFPLISSTPLSIIPILNFRIIYKFSWYPYALDQCHFLLSVDLRNFHVIMTPFHNPFHDPL